MFKCILAGLAAFVLLTATLIPDDAYARRGGGVASAAMEAVFTAAACWPHSWRALCGASSPGTSDSRSPDSRSPRSSNRGLPWSRLLSAGLGYGAAAVGAAAAYGAYGYYGNNYGCNYDNYGQWTCPQQYQY